MSEAISPFAPAKLAALPPLAGVRLTGHACGIRYKGRTDLMLMELVSGTTVAGVFTRSLTAAAPVLWCRKALKKGRARLVVVNSGNANAFTGKAGIEGVTATVRKAAKVAKCRDDEVFVASTGTIGVPLPSEKIVAALETAHAKLKADGWKQAAEAIMTTDTFAKVATRQAKIGDTVVTINGMAKGAGMIAPDMATMLSYVATDAKLPASVLQTLLAKGTDKSFNAITVDSDTSTSDTLMLFATGQAKHPRIASANDPKLKAFRKALDDLLLDLALQIVKDGEGLSKFVQIDITGAQSAKAARRIGFAIANSPLVKTAIAGEDANWGRIVMAVGKSGEKADRDALDIRIGGVQVTEGGGPVKGFDETPITQHMKGREIHIAVDVGVGRGKSTVWTCDLTHAYIDINGSYRT